MPLYDWSTKGAFDAAYDFSGEPDGHPSDRPEVRLHYHRSVMMPYATTVAHGLVAALGWGATTRVVVVGAGFGWTVEVLRTLGLGRVVGIDTSSYVQSRKTQPEDDEVRASIIRAGLDPASSRGAELLARHSDGLPRSRVASDLANENLTTGASRARVRQIMGSQSFEVLTESVLESFTDAEAQQVSAFAHSATSGRVSHYIFPRAEGNFLPLNWKILEEWKALIPADSFIEAGTWRVL